MKTRIDLNETISDSLKNKSKHGVLIYSVNIAGIIKYFKTESGAHKFLDNLGYNYNYDDGWYYKMRESEDELQHSRNCLRCKTNSD